MPAVRCCICRKGPPATLHIFPKDDVHLPLWKTICNYDDRDDVSRLKICSNHFLPEDYFEPNAKKLGGMLRLRPNAVPSVSVPNRLTKCDPLDVASKSIENIKLEVAELPEVTVPSATTESMDTSMSIRKQLFPMDVASGSIENIKLEVAELPEVTVPSATTESMDTSMSIRKQLFPMDVASGSIENIKLEVAELPEVTLPSATTESMDTSMSIRKQLFPAKTQLTQVTTGTELDETLPCTPKKRRFHSPRYVGEITSCDVATPRRAKRVVALAQADIKKKARQIKTLQGKVGRLQKKVSSLQGIIKDLRAGNER